MDFRRRRPPPEALRWAEEQLGPRRRVVACRRMTGGLSSAVHLLRVTDGTERASVVLRQYEHTCDAPSVAREAVVLEQLHAGAVTVSTPTLLAADPDGPSAGGHPSLLMSRVEGHVDLAPTDLDAWAGQIAVAAAAIHALELDAPPFESWFHPERHAPTSATDPGLWAAVGDELRGSAPAAATTFLHRDLQPFNLLWARQRLTGVVDWTLASTGPREIDVGHCRLNLTVLHGVEVAERFRLAYEAASGHPVDPWWDRLAIASYDDAWRTFIPIQVHGRTTIDVGGMTSRVEDLLRRSLRRG